MTRRVRAAAQLEVLFASLRGSATAAAPLRVDKHDLPSHCRVCEWPSSPLLLWPNASPRRRRSAARAHRCRARRLVGGGGGGRWRRAPRARRRRARRPAPRPPRLALRALLRVVARQGVAAPFRSHTLEREETPPCAASRARRTPPWGLPGLCHLFSHADLRDPAGRSAGLLPHTSHWHGAKVDKTRSRSPIRRNQVSELRTVEL